MNELCVLIVVDTAGALASGSLVGNCYMVDTNGFVGSWNEGTDQLQTVCQDGQLLAWSAASVSADQQVSITGFSGPMVDQGVCVPTSPLGDGAFTGRVEARGQFASFPYTATLSLAGAQLGVSCAVKVD